MVSVRMAVAIVRVFVYPLGIIPLPNIYCCKPLLWCVSAPWHTSRGTSTLYLLQQPPDPEDIV